MNHAARPRRLLAAAMAILGAAAPGRAHAEIDPKESGRLQAEGLALYARASYAEAIERFQEADTLAPSAIFSLQIGQAYRHLGDCPMALAYFRQYVRRDPVAIERTEIKMALASMELCANHDMVPRTPLPPPPPPPPPIDTGGGKRIAGLVTMAAGVGLVAAGVVLGLRASDAASQVEMAASQHVAWSPTLADTQSRGQRDALLSLIAVGAGAAAFATGGIVFAVGLHSDHQSLRDVSMAVSWRY